MNQHINSPKVITFSRFSELAYIPKDHAPEKWYSSQDREGFRRALAEDVRRVSREIEENSSTHSKRNSTPSHQYACLGIEVYVTEGLAKKVQDTRRSHVNAILHEQARQRYQGVFDAMKLSNASKDSKSTEKRARIVAMGYWLQYTSEESKDSE